MAEIGEPFLHGQLFGFNKNLLKEKEVFSLQRY
jgi:hypothetical protein